MILAKFCSTSRRRMWKRWYNRVGRVASSSRRRRECVHFLARNIVREHKKVRCDSFVLCPASSCSESGIVFFWWCSASSLWTSELRDSHLVREHRALGLVLVNRRHFHVISSPSSFKYVIWWVVSKGG